MVPAFVTVIELLDRGKRRLLVRGFVHQQVLPLHGIAVLADGRIERGVAAETAVHVDHVLLGDAEALGDELDLIGAHVALVERENLALGLAQVEEQFLVVGRGWRMQISGGSASRLCGALCGSRRRSFVGGNRAMLAAPRIGAARWRRRATAQQRATNTTLAATRRHR